MTARLGGRLVFLLALSVFLSPASSIAVEQQSVPPTAESSAPKPSAAVEKMLNDAMSLEDAKQPMESLKKASEALEAAHQTNDVAGAALAQQALAKALQDVARTDDAVAAWIEAAQLWAGIGCTPQQITALVRAGLLRIPDRKSEAETLFGQALSIGKAETQHPEPVAQALYDAGIAIGDRGQEPPALDYLALTLTIREKQAPESLNMVETLNALAKYARNRGIRNTDDQYYSVAKDYATRAVEIGQRVAPDSSLLAESFRRLGTVDLDASSDPVAARQHYLTALSIERTAAPAGSELQATILRDLALLETQLTNFTLAHEYSGEAVAIAERIAPESLLLDGILENEGILETHEGDLPAARQHLQHALEIRQKLHASMGSVWINIGSVALDQYDFAAARTYFEKALAYFTEKFPNTSGIPFALQDLSETYRMQGDFATALEYGKRALANDEAKLGESLDTATALNTVGDVLLEMGQFSQADDYYRKALNMREKLVPGSLQVADSLVDLAKVARAQKNDSLAMEYDRRALEMGQKSCPNSWCVTKILNELGELAYGQGDLAAAEGYLRRVVDVREKSLGPMHPDLARSLNDLALTVAAQGKTTEALADALRAERIGAEHLRVSVRTLSERQALAYEGIRASGLDLALTLVAGHSGMPFARSEVFDAVIRSRALVFDELAARQRSAYGSGGPEVRQLADRLSTTRARLATLVFRGAGDMKPEEYRSLLDQTRQAKEKAEQMLAERSLAFRQDQSRAQLGLKDIAASLPRGTALVASVRYAQHELQEPGSGKAPPEPKPSYAAFVLRAGTQEPEFVRLGSAGEIENLLTAWRRNISEQAELTDTHATAGEGAYRRVGAALRSKIWDPLQPALGHPSEVFVVPDAALHLVSLASLPVGSSQYLIEAGPLIHYLSTERDLVPIPSSHGEGILVVGNPAFDQAGKIVMAANKSSVPGAAGKVLRGTRSACGTFQKLHFSPLPASQQEADNIAAMWKKSIVREDARTIRRSTFSQASGELQQVTGAEASLEAFEQDAPGKRVLHVATHGFFLEGSCESAVQRRSDPSKRDESFLPASAENPLLLSGLAFAGANRRNLTEQNETDGILTAEEIAGINLDGVDWAVLSACDTGVGEIKVGEGVFGLRRAFQVAGAKTVIMSLWPIEDETTRQWMGTLYREHFLNGNDTAKSVRAASLQILRQRRAEHQSTHPFYWGAFIAAGDTR